MSAPTAVLFDMDGTLLDSRPGIVAATNATLRDLGEERAWHPSGSADAGGWAGMASVRRARAHALPDLALSAREQDVAWGAADMARRLVSASVPS